MKTILLLLTLLTIPPAALSQELCESDRSVSTPNGDLVLTRCRDAKKSTVRTFVSVSGKKILEDSYLSEQDFNKPRSIWIFRGDSSPQTGCPQRLYLIDLAGGGKVFEFGVENACNEYHWASWGEKRSVIAIKKNVKFVYEKNGITPPAKNINLIANIEPPRAGPDMDENQLRPFARELALPK